MELEFDLTSLDKKQLSQASGQLMLNIKRRFIIGLVCVLGALSFFYLLAEVMLYQQTVDNQRIQATIVQAKLNRDIHAATQQLLVSRNVKTRRNLLSQINQAAAEIKAQQQRVIADHFFVAKLGTKQHAIYYNAPLKLHQRISDYTEAINSLSTIASDSINAETPQIVIINEESPGHLQKALNAAIQSHLSSVINTGEYFIWLCSVMWLITIVLLVLLGIFVFRPIYFAVKQSFSNLTQSAERINNDWRLEEEMRKHFKREAMQQKAVLNNIEKIIISTDTYGMIKTFNKHAERKLGFLEIEVVGKRTIEFFHDTKDLQARAAELSNEYQKEVLIGFETLIAKAKRGETDDYSWLLCDKSGQSFHLILNYRAIFNDQGEIIGFLAEGAV